MSARMRLQQEAIMKRASEAAASVDGLHERAMPDRGIGVSPHLRNSRFEFRS